MNDKGGHRQAEDDFSPYRYLHPVQKWVVRFGTARASVMKLPSFV